MASIAFHISVRWARLRRAHYAARLDQIASLGLPDGPEVPATMVAFCGASDLPEQVASWRSYRIHVGRPRRTVMVSDGSLGAAEERILRRLEPRLELATLDGIAGDIATPMMRAYASAMPMGRKLLVMRWLERLAPCIYADSDILFYPEAAQLRDPAFWTASEPRYLFDPYPSLDPRLLQNPDESADAVNGGFIVLKGPVAWADVLKRFDDHSGPFGFFTEQTLNHLAIRQAGGVPLDRYRFVLRNEDQWAATDWFAGPQVILRHYISSLRHKMWLRVRQLPGSATTRHSPSAV